MKIGKGDIMLLAKILIMSAAVIVLVAVITLFVLPYLGNLNPA